MPNPNKVNFSVFSFQSSTFNSHRAGFTLIELIVVIFIISLTTALVMPNLWGRGKQALISEAKRTGNTLRYVYDEAAGKKQSYVFKIDLNANSWSYESEEQSRDFSLKENIIFKDVVIPSLGNVSVGEVMMEFGPLGPAEPITIHLEKDEDEYTVKFSHISGRAKIYEGYVL